MIRQTGTATDAVDLLNQFHSFLNSNGCTVHYYEPMDFADYTAGKNLHFSKNGKYYNLRSFIDKKPVHKNLDGTGFEGIVFSGSTGFTSGTITNWNRQPGYPVGDKMSYLMTVSDIVSYDIHIYTNPFSFTGTIEFKPGEFSHFYMGETNGDTDVFITSATMTQHGPSSANSAYYGYALSGSYTKPMFCTDDGNENNLLYCGSGDWTGWKEKAGNPQTTDCVASSIYLDNTSNGQIPNFSNYYSLGTHKGPLHRAQNSAFSLPALMPIYQYVSHDKQWSYVGQIENVFYVNMNNLAPGQVLTYGSDQYVVYPTWKKDWEKPLSSDYGFKCGFAYKIS